MIPAASGGTACVIRSLMSRIVFALIFRSSIISGRRGKAGCRDQRPAPLRRSFPARFRFGSDDFGQGNQPFFFPALKNDPSFEEIDVQDDPGAPLRTVLAGVGKYNRPFRSE